MNISNFHCPFFAFRWIFRRGSAGESSSRTRATKVLLFRRSVCRHRLETGTLTSKKRTHLIRSSRSLATPALAGVRTQLTQHFRCCLSPLKPYLLVTGGPLSEGGAPLRSESGACSGCTYKEAQPLLCRMKRYIFSYALMEVPRVRVREKTNINVSRQGSKTAVLFQVVAHLLSKCVFQPRYKSISEPARLFCGLLLTAALHWRPRAILAR